MTDQNTSKKVLRGKRNRDAESGDQTVEQVAASAPAPAATVAPTTAVKKAKSPKPLPMPPARKGAPADTITFHRAAERPYGCFGNFAGGFPFTTTVPTETDPVPKGVPPSPSSNIKKNDDGDQKGSEKKAVATATASSPPPTTITWQTSEHYFQALKFLGSPADVSTITNCATAFGAACAGRSRQRPLRKNWDKPPTGARTGGGGESSALPQKQLVMKDALRFKFSQNPRILKVLLDSGDRPIEEYSKKDKYWGNGGDGSGQNVLGKLLMEVRTELRKEQTEQKEESAAEGRKMNNEAVEGEKKAQE